MHRTPQPITPEEFVKFLQKCCPPLGWPRRLAIATSGGPDSTCLLFLFKRLIESNALPHGPKRLVAISINHNAQAASNTMAAQAQELSSLLNIRHLEIKIPWGSPPYPPKPKDSTFEAVARLARYHAIFRGMEMSKCSMVAFGHHLDDQIETSLMRISKGSSELGAAGMKPIRRWGMGEPGTVSNLGFYGKSGLVTWIIRPLLSIHKDRAIATCDTNQLDYVVDQTNFQPELTLRNSIRAFLEEQSRDVSVQPCIDLGVQDSPTSIELVPDPITTLQRMCSMGMPHGGTAKSHIDSTGRNHETLESSHFHLVTMRDTVEYSAEATLARIACPAPVGTCILKVCSLQTINDRLVLRALISRVLRYISPHPWGNVIAEGGRKQSSLDRIANRITNIEDENFLSPFQAGGGVVWYPVILSSDSSTSCRVLDLKTRDQGKDGEPAWIASRAPPVKYRRLVSQRKCENPLRQDVTGLLVDAIRNRRRTVDILFDNRFSIAFDLQAIPNMLKENLVSDMTGACHSLDTYSVRSLSRVHVASDEVLFWPKVILEHSAEEKCIHNLVEPYTAIPNSAMWQQDFRVAGKAKKVVHAQPMDSGWIKQQWIRPLLDLN